MAEIKSNAPADKNAGKAVGSDLLSGKPAEGSHPIRPLSEQDWAAENLEYREMPDRLKPDPSTVAEIQILPEDKQ